MSENTIKLIHCADLHLDARMTSQLPREKARERRAELLHTFDRMLDWAQEHRVDAILIAGDLFDTKNISAAAKNTVREGILAHPDIQFFYLRGNHDADGFLGSLEELPGNLKLFEAQQWLTYLLAQGRVAVTGAELCGETKERLFSSLALDGDRFNIVLLHGQEADSAPREGAEVIPLRLLKNRGIDYLALGHIHAYKSAPLDARGVYCYPGCLEGRGFDECGLHGFVYLEIDPEQKTCRKEFVPFARRQICRLEVDVTGCASGAQIAALVRERLEKEGLSPESLVKICLVGQVDISCEKNLDFLEKKLEPEFYCVRLSDETTLQVDYGRFALDASLKGEFVRLVEQAQDLSAGEKAEVIRCGIRALSGEEPM